MYAYMYNGCYIKSLSGSLHSYSTGGTTIKYYYFEDIASYITTDKSYTGIEYDSSIKMMLHNVVYKEATRFCLTGSKIFSQHDILGQDWKLLLPEAYLYRIYAYKDSYSGGSYYEDEYVGAFRDINGNVYTLEGRDNITAYYDETKNSIYKAYYFPNNNNYLKFESFYKLQELYEDGPKYNFVVYDSTGLTYYMYDTGLKWLGRPDSKQSIYILAVKDEYGNMIRYEYENGYGNVTKIIDTYGREINISPMSSNRKQISYNDENGKTKTITYTTEYKLPASSLDNDSPIKPKEVSRFTVTNEEGEKTIYDARKGVVLNYYSDSSIKDVNTPRDIHVHISFPL